MSIYQQTVPQLTKMLTNLDAWLGEAVEYADSRGFEPDTLLQARLSPDMFPLVRQIQSAADTAKFTGSRLTGVDAPKNEDNETTLAELRARIAATIGFLETIDEGAFNAGLSKDLKLPMLNGGSVLGLDYLTGFATPNFYFHISQAYAILRNNGVKLGKRKYLGAFGNIKPPA